MWYTGNSPEPIGSVGYASSLDGITWNKHGNNPVLVDEPYGGWNEQTVYEPSVIFHGSIFHMWYTSSDDPLLPGPIHIHHAISSDGLTWVKDTLNNPVLSPGSNGSWDDLWVDSHCIIFVDSIYHMWYSGANGTFVRIGHATSADGVTWTKDVDNPVLSYGTAGSWDYPRVEGPNVIYDGSVYHMWYNGGSHSAWRIGYATSPDGINWTKYAGNPVLNWGPQGNWDDTSVGFCSVLLDTLTSTYSMWYTGSDTSLLNQSPWGAVAQIGYASSPDGITWTKNPNPITDLHGEPNAGIPNTINLSQNYPNPFNSTTIINYQLSRTSDVELSIYNLLGQKIATPVSKYQPAGIYNVQWDATGFASGVYLYKLQVGDFVETKKMILLR